MTAVRKEIMSNETAELSIDGKSIELPVVVGSEGEKGLDISKLRAQTGIVTIDNGFVNTASCASAVTFLNGEEGVLKYRGYKIEELAEKSNFIEVAYLLVYGELPDRDQLTWFQEKINSFSETKAEVKNLMKQFPKDAHPMGVLSSVLSSMSAFYPEYLDQDLSKDKKDAIMAQLIAQVKNIAAYFYRVSQGQDLVDSKPNQFDYCSDFLNMMYGGGDYKPDPEVAKALNVLLILHADHEQNCSTSTVRLVGSSKANLYASIASGVSALWGPLHGGANQAVIEMLMQIQDDGGDYKKFLDKAKDKNDPFRLMGFGHRVYKNFDPRARIIKKACDTILEKLSIKDPLLDIAKGLEEEALKDSYFVERKLYPNVDFYSGIIYKALNIPTNMFTVMFALGRLPGWIAQWKEMIESSATKIGRPRQIFVGETDMAYKPIDQR
ncbi:citrate synthase [Pseudobacteriovorax antillogorgiicola]|uniref:Citrate synthase n=1 Tax=Pseudobacteriovorax antillogorgiicola TaxID=1513793 RepID=A0A1Y6B3I7_9BACT|nr:citrate synthase [Pseudobacteriovorax antillogorgiicola]TCS59296.1 citrate synthase [Pseudobacteriovorax antillogorgiicola]SME89628.1 citrate synthase [Pseudobacteriovorax antillogorgiicola]